MSSRTLTTEAVVLRSIRFSEADCVLHLYTLEKGRVGGIAKGVRKTRSRFGARLEPLSHVELLSTRAVATCTRFAAPSSSAPTTAPAPTRTGSRWGTSGWRQC
jgi:recombinational DNA repair protein (RecF pathway)